MQERLFMVTLICCLAVLVGCTPERKFQPGTDYPEWAFDKDTYYEPSEDPVPFIEGIDGSPDIYFSRQHVVFIKRPDRPGLREVPRPAVFITKDNGQTWEKVGHFGREQTYFALQVKDDGTYGTCVIGIHRPDLASANLQIQQIRVIDSQAPKIELTIDPEQGPYWLGQRIVMSWSISDPHLGATPGKLLSRVVEFDKASPWEIRKDKLASTGTISVAVERLPLRADGLNFRVEAVDQMGNIAVTHTDMLELLSSPPAQAKPAAVIQKPSPPSATRTVIIPQSSKTIEPKASPENTPPWSWQNPALQPAPSTPKTDSSEPQDKLPPAGESESRLQISASEPLTMGDFAQPDESNSPDKEMAELERLLSEVSGPVFQGKVKTHTQPQAQATTAQARQPTVVVEPIAKVPKVPAKVVPQTPVEKSAPAQPIVVIITPPLPPKAQPLYEPAHAKEPVIEIVAVQSQPAKKHVEKTITADSSAAAVVVARPMDEQVEKPIITITPIEPTLVAEPILVEAAPKPDQPLLMPITAEPSSTTVAVEPIVIAEPPDDSANELVIDIPPASASEPTAIITVESTAPTPAVTATVAPPPTTTTTATATLSRGKTRIAKPWERLGNRAASARDFYQHAPSLSNY